MTMIPAGPGPAVRPPSMLFRALLAVALLVGFYVLAIAIAVALLGLCYAIVAFGGRVPVRLIVILVLGAGMILWSLIPRFDRFVPPGPQLTPQKHPRLFAELAAIAEATGQAMPAEVYLEGDVNAWVAQRGGLMGLGSRRVMGLGLALMRVLTLSEFRAVLAHEFGHYHGGDTKLGPWIYKTRAAIGRTIMNLGGSALQKPFVWYGNMFLRITHAISRQQELTADRLAATVVGREALADGLVKTHSAGMAFNPFWRSEVVPVLSAGFRPPLAEGFARFLQASNVATAVDKALDEELREHKKNPYDTHPPLAERIAAVQDLPPHEVTGQEPAAISLLEDLPAVECAFLMSIADPTAVAKLADTTWEQVTAVVYVPMWRKVAAENRKELTGLTPEALPEKAAGVAKGFVGLSDDTRRRGGIIGAALTIAALDAGATIECDVGSEIAVVRDELRVQMFTVFGRLAKGELSAQEWRDQCIALDITGVDLAGVGAAGAMSS